MYSRVKYLTIAAVIVAALILSGCCSFTPPVAQPSAAPTPAASATPLPSVTPVPSGKPFDIGNRLSFMYTVSQYDGASKTMTTTDLYDYQKITLPNGKPGYSMQYISTKHGSSISIMVSNYYDDAGRPVNGTYKRVDNGVEIEKHELGADAVPGHDLLNFVVTKADIPSGYENVSVVAGTKSCAKFVSPDGTKTIWMGENIPVPMKIEKADGNNKAVYELISWSKQ